MNFRKLTDSHLTGLFRGIGSEKVPVSVQERAFEEIYRRYWLQLFQVAWQKTGEREAAEELVQELFVRLWERRLELEVTSSLKNYLHTAIRYRIMNFIRDQMLSSRHLIAIKNSFSAPAENMIEQDLRLRELDTSLKASIKKLPLKSRTIFELSRGRHFSNKQIAGQLKISEKTVEYHLTKSLKLLRVYLKDFVTVLLIILMGL
ncbi:RNA polymerase sigma-70 factor (ECF subfamily) [Anseongella ginsenosidimutans]|uniref:RNA polymerase sigma-70 factor (ECF subfamily) n=1 Tax=Anseongella ginsenosidimutans TaxID=496056 RepID=A0A4R3KU85_9SPHI|nr:RNA polymerase sigma-70 factor [Anseongella ginsenosidimutans]TCS88939.1 RNA polymerase sigma-70 factor (ECF subfamily) [Anseongella ginsenosidimutans]